MAKRDIFSELMDGVSAMKGPSRRHDYPAQLQSRGCAAAEGGLETHSGHTKEAALLASSVCAQIANQRKNAGEVGTGAGETESAGGSAGAAGAEISGYAGAVG
jgi:hypothetical protein